MNNIAVATDHKPTLRSLLLSWSTTPDPLLVMLVVSVTAGVFLLVAGGWLGFRASYEGTQIPTVAAPDFRLTDQSGVQRSLSDFRGGPVLLTFLDAHCSDQCPATAEKLRTVSQMLGTDAVGVSMVAVSVDPQKDTVAAAQAFSKQHAPSKGWYFMTGSVDQLVRVWKDYGVTVLEAKSVAAGSSTDADGLIHALPLIIIDADGNERLSYTADFDPNKMVHDLRLLMGANDGVPTVPFGLD